MKEPWSISKAKLVDLEEGTSHNEEHECAKPARKNDGSKQAIQCVKLFLYLGLLMIVGWACYSIWQPYHAQSMEVKVMATIQELESQNLLLLEEQATQETSTIAARPLYESEDTKKQDVVDNLQTFSPDDQDEILNSENTESSLDWPIYLPKGMNFPFFLPSFSSESEKEPGSSESAQEKNLLDNYMFLSLFVQNSVRVSEALKDSKEVVDPKFHLKLEGFDRLELENSGPSGLEDSSRLELDNSSPLQLFSLGPLESQKEIGSDQKDSEEKPIPTQTDDNHGIFILLNHTYEIVPEDSTEPEQEEALIKSNEQMYDWFNQNTSEDRKHKEEQSLLEKSTESNAEASEDSTEEVDHDLKVTSEDLSQLDLKDSGPLEMKDLGALESEGLDPFEWEYSDQLASMNWSPEWEQSGPLESQKEIGSDLEDSEEKPISEDREHDEEQDTDETKAEIDDDEISSYAYDSSDSIGNTHSLGLHSDTGGSSLENESDEESESDSFDWMTYQLLLNRALRACNGRRFALWIFAEPEDLNNSYDSGVDTCNVHTKAFCEYGERTLKFHDCSSFSIYGLRSD